MTEQEWLTADAFTAEQWDEVFDVLPPRFTRRYGHRLLAASLVRVAHLFTDTRTKDAVRYIERSADGNAAWDERHYHRKAVEQVSDDARRLEAPLTRAQATALEAVWLALSGSRSEMLDAVVACVMTLAEESGTPFTDESRPFTRILRDVAGNPFRRPRFDWHWRTPTAVGLARAIHADRAFDRMPILADALEEAGCDDADILTHCRDADGTHVRGCWVLDPILDHG